MNNNFGGFFEDAYECTHPKIDRVLNAFGEPHSADVLFQNDQIEISRLVLQTQVGMIRQYKVMLIAQLANVDKYIVTCGTIRTSKPEKYAEYEKIGKRILYKATKQIWKVQY